MWWLVLGDSFAFRVAFVDGLHLVQVLTVGDPSGGEAVVARRGFGQGGVALADGADGMGGVVAEDAPDMVDRFGEVVFDLDAVVHPCIAVDAPHHAVQHIDTGGVEGVGEHVGQVGGNDGSLAVADGGVGLDDGIIFLGLDAFGLGFFPGVSRVGRWLDLDGGC